MTIHVFGSRMGNDVGTPLDGTTVDGGGEGVIHDEGHAMTMSCLGKFFDIQYGEGRIGNGFAKNSLGILLKGSI